MVRTEESWILSMFWGFSSIFFGCTLGAKLMVQKCKSTDDCIEGYHCQDEICQKCLTCEVIFRKGQSCLTNFNQCGECLDGIRDKDCKSFCSYPNCDHRYCLHPRYEDPMVTDYSTITKPCTAIKISQEEKCWYDKMCAQSSYCHQGSCVKCFDCSLYNRLTPTNGCAKEFYECGSCMNGFYEVPVTTAWNTKPCKSATQEVSNATVLPSVVISQTTIPLTYLLSSVFALAVAMAILIILLRRKKKLHIPLNRSESNTPVPAPPPPPYTPSPFSHPLPSFPRPSAPTLSEIDTSQSRKLLEIEDEAVGECPPEFESEEIQTAKIFKLPSASYYYNEPEEAERLNNEAGEDGSDQSSTDSETRCFGENFGVQPEGGGSVVTNQEESNVASVPEIGVHAIDTVDGVDSVSIIEILITDSSDSLQPEDNSVEGE